MGMGCYSPRPSPKDDVEGNPPSNPLNMISCSCKKGCRNACSCRKAGLKCSIVCGTCNGQSCENLPEITIDVNVLTHDFDELNDDDEMDRLLDYRVSQLAGDSIDQVEEQHQNFLNLDCFTLELPEITIDVNVLTHDFDELADDDDDEMDKLLDYRVSQLAGDSIDQVEEQHQEVQDAENGTEGGGLADLFAPGPSKRRKKL